MHVSAAETEQQIKDDLLKQQDLKIEIASFFGRNFFPAMRSPLADTRVYDFIKHMHQLTKKLDIKQQVSQKPERITRKYSDPKYDNEE